MIPNRNLGNDQWKWFKEMKTDHLKKFTIEIFGIFLVISIFQMVTSN